MLSLMTTAQPTKRTTARNPCDMINLPVQDVSEPVASSPAAFVEPAAHAAHILDDTYSSSAHRVATAHSLCLDHAPFSIWIMLEFTERYQRRKCPSPSRRRLLHSWSQRHKQHTHSTTHIRPQRTGSLSFITHHTSHITHHTSHITHHTSFSRSMIYAT